MQANLHARGFDLVEPAAHELVLGVPVEHRGRACPECGAGRHHRHGRHNHHYNHHFHGGVLAVAGARPIVTHETAPAAIREIVRQ